MKNKLERLTIKGFKSIKFLEDFPIKDINIMIGQNSAGKSNLIGFFRMLSFAVNAPLEFQEKYVNRQGRASGLLHDGIKVTSQIVGQLVISTDLGINYYDFTLGLIGNENLIYTSERVKFDANKLESRAKEDGWINLTEFGNQTSSLSIQENYIDSPRAKTIGTIRYLLTMVRSYQFHDTSADSYLRRSWQVNDGRYLKDHGQNLAAYLYSVKQIDYQIYIRIVGYIQQIIPNFADFVLEPTGGWIELRWRERNSEYEFSAFQASDGMLRFMCLVALLVAKPDAYPTIMFIDEPELGLHPEAILFVSELLKKASAYCQIFVSTQSIKLLDQFDAEDVIVVERNDRVSEYKRLETAELLGWLETFETIGNIWESNLIGGRP